MRLLALLTAAVMCASCAAAQARPTSKRPSRLWATVNVCDTRAHPDTIGVRASMPGTGVRRQRMFMRFQVQFFKPSDSRWHKLTTDGDDRFVPVGSARFRRREAGRNVTIKPPPPGSSYRLRGLVTFEWRRGATVLRRAVRHTRGGHKGTAGSDPKGFSAGECRILP